MGSVPDTRHASIPAALTRLWWWMILPCPGIIVGGVIFVLPAGQAIVSKVSAWLSLGIPAFFIAPLFNAIIGIVGAQARVAKAVRAADGRE